MGEADAAAAQAAEEAREAAERLCRDAQATEEAREAAERQRRAAQAAQEAREAAERQRRDAQAAQEAREADEWQRRDAQAAEVARSASAADPSASGAAPPPTRNPPRLGAGLTARSKDGSRKSGRAALPPRLDSTAEDARSAAAGPPPMAPGEAGPTAGVAPLGLVNPLYSPATGDTTMGDIEQVTLCPLAPAPMDPKVRPMWADQEERGSGTRPTPSDLPTHRPHGSPPPNTDSPILSPTCRTRAHHLIGGRSQRLMLAAPPPHHNPRTHGTTLVFPRHRPMAAPSEPSELFSLSDSGPLMAVPEGCPEALCAIAAICPPGSSPHRDGPNAHVLALRTIPETQINEGLDS
jgi:hypothetical protein